MDADRPVYIDDMIQVARNHIVIHHAMNDACDTLYSGESILTE